MPNKGKQKVLKNEWFYYVLRRHGIGSIYCLIKENKNYFEKLNGVPST